MVTSLQGTDMATTIMTYKCVMPDKEIYWWNTDGNIVVELFIWQWRCIKGGEYMKKLLIWKVTKFKINN